MRNWHNFDTLARGHIDHSGMRVSKLLATHQVHGFNHSKTIEVVEINMSATYRKITQASISDEKKKKKKFVYFISYFEIFKVRNCEKSIVSYFLFPIKLFISYQSSTS